MRTRRKTGSAQRRLFVGLLMGLPVLAAIGLAGPAAAPLAFPTAEGYGRMTTGGRGGEVFEVTTLKDYGAGSLREAVEEFGPRTIVFRVSGIIKLEMPLTIRRGDITIAGQTAPGDGICLRGYPLNIEADNVIIRYLRVRLGDEEKVESDCIFARQHKDIILDHVSGSWSTDEGLSFYDNENFTLQWSLVSESLYQSVHVKGNHGYGGIWGGMGASFHHNLLAHHSSRNPRFCGSRYHGNPAAEIVDFRNNVIYNWGFNSAYGGEAGNHNLVNNYYKSGPATKAKVRSRIVNPSDTLGRWYVTGNYVDGSPDVTADNWNGGVQPDSSGALQTIRVGMPFPFAPVTTQTAIEAYELVLKKAGAVLPKRDALDARIVNEVRTGTAAYGGVYAGPTGGIIDSQKTVGGWPELKSAPAPQDTDHDGMPDAWEKAQGLNPADPKDRNGDHDGDGYTNLEEYLNELAGEN